MNVIVITKPNCIWCDKLKDLLRMHSIACHEHVIHEPVDQRQFFIDRLFDLNETERTFPQVFFEPAGGQRVARNYKPVPAGAQHIGGYLDTQAWIQQGGHLDGTV